MSTSSSSTKSRYKKDPQEVSLQANRDPINQDPNQDNQDHNNDNQDVLQNCKRNWKFAIYLCSSILRCLLIGIFVAIYNFKNQTIS